MRRVGCLVALAVVLVGAAGLWGYRRQDYRPLFAREAGELVAVRDSTGIGYGPDGKLVTDVTLVSDSGLEVLLRVRAAERSDGELRPAIILMGGFRTGRRAAEIPPETGDLVVASVEYPYHGPRRGLSGWDWVRRVPALREAAFETPAALLLATQYLYARQDVDPSRVTIVGVSLGVPFTVAAVATDRRVSGIALLHGGGDISTIFAHAYGDRMPARLVPVVATLVEWAMAPLEPTRYVEAIAPRPLLMVNATGDALIPHESVVALYDAAREPKRLVWFDSAHVARNETEAIAELMGVTLQWMEISGLR
ncbi:MAG: alpha/beta hydrolase [Gemmatimonadetes bacterium]|nr:alpha/beta hydrolase [Gemmatimonadota bacterium]